MREDHGVDQAKPRGERHSQQGRDARQNIRAEKDAAKHACIYMPNFT